MRRMNIYFIFIFLIYVFFRIILNLFFFVIYVLWVDVFDLMVNVIGLGRGKILV